MEEDIRNIAGKYLEELKKAIESINLDDIQKITEILMDVYKNDRRVFILGNGGSAATASHMACDLGKGTLRNVYDASEKRFQVISLTDNVPMMTAFANDLSYDDIFVQQLKNYVQKGDVVIGISGSGNTPNVIKALLYAKSVGAKTIGLLGFNTGGNAKDLVDHHIVIKSNSYGVVEDLHLALDHILTTCLSYMKHAHDHGKAGGDSPVEWKERSTRR
jgi:D-sedoheptulose 7-phosphate isomerase